MILNFYYSYNFFLYFYLYLLFADTMSIGLIFIIKFIYNFFSSFAYSIEHSKFETNGFDGLFPFHLNHENINFDFKIVIDYENHEIWNKYHYILFFGKDLFTLICACFLTYTLSFCFMEYSTFV